MMKIISFFYDKRKKHIHNTKNLEHIFDSFNVNFFMCKKER